jgi:hypothetical protein
MVTLPPCFSRSCRAASMACSSNRLIRGSMLGGGMTLFRSGSILNVSAGASQSGTCLMQTIRFSGTPLSPSRLRHRIASLAPNQRLSTSSRYGVCGLHPLLRRKDLAGEAYLIV